MLELDLVLAPFVEARYGELGPGDRQCFEKLMLCEDQDLFSWFLGREEPADPELSDIVKQILEFTGTRSYN